MANTEKVVTADQGGRITLGRSRAGCSFRVLEQGDNLVLEPVETVHVPTREAWLYTNTDALGAVRRGLEQLASGAIVEGPDLDAAHALALAFPSDQETEQHRDVVFISSAPKAPGIPGFTPIPSPH